MVLDKSLGYSRCMPSDPVVARRAMDSLLRGGRMTSLDPAWFQYRGRLLSPGGIVEVLRPHVSTNRLRRIETTLAGRTYNLAVVVDGMVDTGNVSAVMRSADAFGVQVFHAIDRGRTYKHSRRTAQGVRKWLDRYVWRSPTEAIEALHSRGYRIIVADTDPVAVPLEAIDFTQKTALVFGNELAGVGADFRREADALAGIAMSGFARSLNVSVAAAVCLYEARRNRLEVLGHHGDLSVEQRDRLRAVFVIKSVRHATEIIERALEDGFTDPGW